MRSASRRIAPRPFLDTPAGLLDRDEDLQALAFAAQGQAQLGADARPRQLVAELGRGLDGAPVHRDHDVSGLDAGPVGRAPAQELDDDDALAGLQARLVRDVADLGDPDPAAHHAPLADELAHYGAREVGGDGEADALVAPRLRVDRGVDPDELSARVEEGAAGVP